MTLEDRVRAALDSVKDPCSEVAGVPAGLLEMGLVHTLEIDPGDPGAAVRVAIGVTEPTCLMGPALASGARTAVEAVEGVAHVEVTLTGELDWSPAHMTPDYRARLSTRRAERRGELRVVETPAGGAMRAGR